MTTPIIAAVIALLAIPFAAHAQPPDRDAITAPRIVVLASVRTKDAGRREALRAARLLDSPLALDTVSPVPAERPYGGAVVTLHRSRGRIVVSSYLGDAPDAETSLRAAQRYFPSARVTPTALPQGDSPPFDGWIDGPWVSAGLLVVGSHADYPAALRAARRFSAAAGLTYSDGGRVFDHVRGLIIPDDDPDEAYRGKYVARRYDTFCDGQPCVTVERSEGYQGLRPGLYIVVAGILRRGAEAEARLQQARLIVPSAYVKQTVLYMGCMH